MLHPLVVVSIGEIFSGMGTSRLLSCGSGDDSLDGVLHDIPQLERLDQITALMSSDLHQQNESTYEFQIIDRSLIPISSY